MKKLLIPAVLAAACAVAFAKLPPPDEATKAKAAETAARTAWQGKVDAFQLCKSQDKVAARFRKTSATTGPAAKPAMAANATPATTTAAGAPAATQTAAAAPTSATAPIAPATTAAAAPPTPCAEPGPFAYNPPEQKPLETAGAHSPAGNAASPPSVIQQSSEMAPAKK